MTIQLLDERTIGKICAGEVIERPASVVKELIENAIDAGATRITTQVVGGGMSLLEVTDNGVGIAPEELPLVFDRHATSKLTAFEDLDHLHTLGFRGEAIPSISAVAEVTVTSRTESQSGAIRMTTRYGSRGAFERTGADFGTAVSVVDLFDNVPARRKFLKKPATENAAIVRVIEAYALAYPGIAFRLSIDGRTSITTSGADDPADAVAAVYGTDIANAILPLESDDLAITSTTVEVTGWIAAPTVSRATRQQMLFFVNGRLVQNRPLNFALEDAYHSLLMVGRHPISTIHIAVSSDVVDINVHPTKAEVKFADERSITRTVSRAAHSALASMPGPPVPELSFGGSGQILRSQPDPLPLGLASTPMSSGPDRSTQPQDATIIHTRNLPALRVLGQVSSTYIIAEGPEGLYLIDQHAAHERVVYERYLAHLAGASMDIQPLLDPMVIDLAPEQRAVFDRSVEELAALGFNAEAFGDGAIVVRSVPANATNVDIEERLHLILAELAEGGNGDSWIDSVAISVACHTSIRAGQALSLTEMRELVEQLEATQHPRACGHGRPTMLSLSQFELEKQFSRR